MNVTTYWYEDSEPFPRLVVQFACGTSLSLENRHRNVAGLSHIYPFRLAGDMGEWIDDPEEGEIYVTPSYHRINIDWYNQIFWIDGDGCVYDFKPKSTLSKPKIKRNLPDWF